MFGGMNFFPEVPRPFNTQYRCYPVAMMPGGERSDVEAGGKIIMPPSALDQLTRLNIVYPMLFKLSNKKTSKTTHCGVLEFVADEGKIYIPYWMMQNLMLETGGLVTVESATLPVATYSKFQPLSKDFLDLTNPKAVLEMRLRHFACLSKGDIVAINYNNKVYELNVMETKPAAAVSIIECDMNVDFEAPPGYEEPTYTRAAQPMEEEEPELDISQMLPEDQGFLAFAGSGNRLDGKKKRTNRWRLHRAIQHSGSWSPAVHPTTCPSIHLSIHQFIYPVFHPFIHLSIYPSNHLSFHSSIYLSSLPSIYPSIHPSTCPASSPSETEIQSRQLAEYTRGIPDYNFQVGDIRFIRAKKKAAADKENEEGEFKAFEGSGQSLRQAKKK